LGERELNASKYSHYIRAMVNLPTQSPRSIPRRLGADLRESGRMARRLKLLIRGNPEPTPLLWKVLGEALLVGDEPADRLAEWMISGDGASARADFERALARGIESVREPAPALKDFFQLVEPRPSWVDAAELAEGARACGISGSAGLDVLRDLALMGGYQLSALNRTLLATGPLVAGAQRRLAETTKWWMSCTAPEGMSRFAPGYMDTLRVRLTHAMVRRHLRRSPDWDEEAWGVPINQTDMALTYLGFSVMFLFGQRFMGVWLTRREGQAVMHLWRYIGWLMGVEERWLCNTEMEGRIALYQNLLSQAPSDESSRALGRALMVEPLGRHYGGFEWLQRRYHHARHLSNSRLFLGHEGMLALGLPRAVMPWYPVLSVPFTAVWHGAHRVWPGGKRRLIERGRKAQLEALPVLFGRAT